MTPRAPQGRSAEAVAEALGDGFDIVRTLGTGSVATVFLAREKALSRLVAIKVMNPGTAGNETTRRRFEREARAAASLSDHPNVVAVHRYGLLPDQSPYIVMRFVKGRTMEERLAAEGRLELSQALTALAAVADALTLAHSKGIVHRDVRPGNVLWDEESGTALLTDFGIAAILATSDTDATRLTTAGEIIGDPRYLSPEQLQDQDLTEMSDIYGFGVLGYELLTGEGPYEARGTAQWIRAHLTQDPRDLRSLRPDVPQAVADLLRRCLSREPNHRPTATDVGRLLKGGSGAGSPGGAERAGDGSDSGDLQTLLRKRVPQVVLITGAVGYGFTEVVGNFADQDMLRSAAYPAAWVVMITAVLAATVVAWFHGEKGRQRATALEYVLLASIVTAGMAVSAWIFISG